MSDRYIRLVVTLEEPIRDDCADPMINAIKQIKGVLDVTPEVVNHVDHSARLLARRELINKLWEVLK